MMDELRFMDQTDRMNIIGHVNEMDWIDEFWLNVWNKTSQMKLITQVIY